MEKLMNAPEVVDRLREFTGTSSDRQLAEYLGVSHTTPHVWRRNGVPNLAALLPKLKGINIDWLLYGEGDQTRAVGGPRNNPSTDNGESMQDYEQLAAEYGIRIHWEDLDEETREKLRGIRAALAAELKRVRAEFASRMVRAIVRE